MAQYKAEIKASRIKGGGGRRGVMFIHQSLPGDGSSGTASPSTAKRRGRPKKNKFPQQTVVTTTAPVMSSVIKNTSSCGNNDTEDEPLSPTPLQIDLAPSLSPEHVEQNIQQQQQQPSVMHTTTVTVPVNEVATVAPPLPIVTKKRKSRKVENMAKMSFGEQARSIEAGKLISASYSCYMNCIGLKVKRRRGRKSKAMSTLPQRSTVLKDSLSADTAAVMVTSGVAGSGEHSVICDTPTGSQHSIVDKKQRRNMLLMKAQADRAKKRAEVNIRVVN